MTERREYWDEKPAEQKMSSLADYLEDFTVLPLNQLIPGVAYGVSFATVTINAPRHVQYLKGKLESLGVQFFRRRLGHLDHTFLSERTIVVFNCVGNAARHLPRVQDSNRFSVRGQILLARAPQINTNVMRHGKDYETYITSGPYSNGNVSLGGFMQRNNGTGDTFAHETESIWQRTSTLEPSLQASDTEILATFAGLRPGKQGSPRIELEERTARRVIVHSYGANGTGYQAGLGMGMEAVSLALPHLSKTLSNYDVVNLYAAEMSQGRANP